MSKICVVGAGYVGLVTGACFANLGHRVTCVDIDSARVAALRKGLLPIYEPGLEPLFRRNTRAHRLYVTTSFEEGVRGADFVFLCVGTPTTAEHKVDLSFLHVAYVKVSSAISRRDTIIVNKSTVPPGTSAMMERVLAQAMDGMGAPAVVSNPEFLREGHAIDDFLKPDRVVIGARDQQAAQAVADLYAPLQCPILITDPCTAEMIKYASNAFLATKISFINEIAALCERLGVNVTKVSEGVGLDPRIGMDYLRAGIGYGGSCLPKDIAALSHLFTAYGQEAKLLTAVREVNDEQPRRLLRRLREALGTLNSARVVVLGLTFKPNTDDTRCSPAIEMVKALHAEGAEVRVCDPVAWPKASQLASWATCVSDPYEAATGSDAVVVATDWSEFKALDLGRLRDVMRGNILADGRNLFDPADATKAGFRYLGVGRHTSVPNRRNAAEVPR